MNRAFHNEAQAEQVRHTRSKINNKPRKCLGYKIFEALQAAFNSGQIPISLSTSTSGLNSGNYQDGETTEIMLEGEAETRGFGLLKVAIERPCG